MSAGAHSPRAPRAWHLALWLAASVASTMCGIGGGLFAVPILHFLLRVELKVATATSLVAVFAMTLAGTLAELLQPEPALDWRVVGLLCAGGLFGALLGQRLMLRLNARRLTWVFALALCAAGVRVLGGDAAPDLTGAPGGAELGNYGTQAWIAAIGFAGGFVAPLLGIGGGLIVVPALFLGVPGTSYLTARACSTAMSTFTAAHLSWMNLKNGRVQRESLLPFALTAVVGAIIGIALVHRPGWSEVARLLMGVVLVLVGARYAWSALRATKPGGQA